MLSVKYDEEVPVRNFFHREESVHSDTPGSSVVSDAVQSRCEV